MSRKDAKAKGWETFRNNMLQYAKENNDFNLTEFIIKRIESAYSFWREARSAERRRDFEGTRKLYLKAVESLEQAEKITESPAGTKYLEMLKNEYYNFVVHRDPLYRMILKHPLLRINENPGILQTELYEQFKSHKKEDLTYALYFAEKEGLVRREEKGRSYQLFFIRDKEGDPFLKFEDDEIDIQEKTTQEAATKKGCLFIFEWIFWIGALFAVGAYTGLVGAGIVVAAFIVWKIIKKIMQKKQKQVSR